MYRSVKVNGTTTFGVLIPEAEFRSGLALAEGVIPVDVRREGYSAQALVPLEDAQDIEKLVRNADFQSAIASVWVNCFGSLITRPFDISYETTHTIKSYHEGYDPADEA